MYKLDIRVDTKESAAIERRRIMEEQRKSRIFNARERIIGLDLDALQKQTSERKQREEEEKQRDQAFESEMNRCSKIGELLDQRQARDREENNKLLVEFRKEHQRMIDRREFDLNDPDIIKNGLPARVSDDDPRLSLSGMQKFDGEDIKYEERKKLQQKQIKDWTSQQAAEKKRLEDEEKDAERLYQLKACELDQRAVELATAEETTRKALNIAVKDYNLALTKEKTAQKQHERVQEEDDNFTEISNNIHGDMLSENPDVAQSAFGPHRVVPDRWKGMSPQQVEDVRRTQEMQREEKEILSREEKLIQEEWDRQRVAQAHAGLILEGRITKKLRELNCVLAEENRRLAGEQRNQQENLTKEFCTNQPTPAFFSQFNTTSR